MLARKITQPTGRPIRMIPNRVPHSAYLPNYIRYVDEEDAPHYDDNTYAQRQHHWMYTEKAGTIVEGRTLSLDACWCGQPLNHDWPRREQGAPHPR